MIVNTSCKIVQDWVIDLNDGIKHLAFWIMGQSHMVPLSNPLIRIHFLVIREDFEATIFITKA